MHLKPNPAFPKPAYWLVTVPEHWVDKVHAVIEKDVQAGALMKVSLNEPTI